MIVYTKEAKDWTKEARINSPVPVYAVKTSQFPGNEQFFSPSIKFCSPIIMIVNFLLSIRLGNSHWKVYQIHRLIHHSAFKVSTAFFIAAASSKEDCMYKSAAHSASSNKQICFKLTKSNTVTSDILVPISKY